MDTKVRLNQTTIGAGTALVALALYLAAAVRSVPAFLYAALTWNSDATTPMVLAEALTGSHGTIHLANSTPYSTLLVDILTYHLPGHRAIWLAWPLLAYLVAVLILGRSVASLGGAGAGLLSAVLALAMAPPVFFPILAQGYHAPTAITCVLLAAHLVRLAGPPGHRGWAFGLALGLGLLVGLNLASDPLLGVAGLGPYAVVLLVLSAPWRETAARRMGITGGVVMASALAGYLATLTLAARAGLRGGSAIPHLLVSSAQLLRQSELTGTLLQEMLGGTWAAVLVQPQLRLRYLLLTVAVVAVSGTLVILALARRSTPASRPVQAHLAVWSLMVAATVAAIATSSAANDLWSVRYATVVWVAVAALLPLLPARWRSLRLATACLVVGMVGFNAGALWQLPDSSSRGGDMSAAVTFLRSHGVRHGYADYWEANSATWASNGDVTLRAVRPCAQGDGLCAFHFSEDDAWYRVQPGPVAVVADPQLSVPASPPVGFGTPISVDRIGALTVYIYSRDPGVHFDA